MVKDTFCHFGVYRVDVIVTSHGNCWYIFRLIWIEETKTYTKVPNTAPWGSYYGISMRDMSQKMTFVREVIIPFGQCDGI